jgi:hypothetical protein
MATIRIHRTSEYINGMRNYRILIDNKQVGTIADGETKEFVTEAGQRTITAKIDWCSSPDILLDVKDGETIALRVGGFKNGSWLMYLGGGILLLHFILSVTLNFDFAVFLVIPVFILLAYFLTVGRKSYLTLTKI